MKKKKMDIHSCYLDRILILMYSIMVFGYLGPLGKYRLLTIYITAIVQFAILFFCKRRRRFEDVNFFWILFFTYVFLSFLFLNRKNGYEYVLMLACGMMALAMDQDDCFFSRLFKVWRNIAVVFGILTIINVFIPNLVYGYFSFLLTQAQIDTIQNNILLGGYPGIAGEVSFNCFCIAIGIAVQVIFLYFEKQKVRNFFILFLLFIALLLTGKRSMILILPIVSIIIFMLLAIEKRNKYVREILTLLIIAAPLVYLGLRDEITLILTKGGTSLALSNRDWFWNIAEEMFRKHPFWGNGINTYDFMYNEYKVRNGYVYFAGAHNSYLQYAAELGAIGLGVFIICILSEIIRTIKKINLDFKKHSSLISIENLFISLYAQLFCILYALSENPFYQPQQIMTYFIVISCLRCCRRKEKDEYFIS